MSRRPDSRCPDRPEQRLWHGLTAAQVLAALDSDPANGLGATEAASRLSAAGPNALPRPTRPSPVLRLTRQFHNPLIYVLLAAGAITLALADYVDAGVILSVVCINAAIGFIQEGRAEQALQAVHALLARRANVIRDGERHAIDATELVPGDLVLLEPGDRVPADLRLLQARDLHIDEAPLTGESLPVSKVTAAVDSATALGDRRCLAHAGTLVTRGQARGLVVATGPHTEIGKIGSLVATVETLATPLTRRLDRFARRITALILMAGALVLAYGHLIRDLPLLDAFLVVVGLAVAAIPEGLPAIVTITLALGTRAMARRQALVRRLPAVETLGSVTVICSDKTGTLTHNQMTAVEVLLPRRTLAVTGAGYAPEGGFRDASGVIDPHQDQDLRALARCALLCNDARLHRDHDSGAWQLCGDPTEGALLSLALKSGLDPLTEPRETPRVDAIPFDAERRFMATLHRDHRGTGFILLKGAPETVLALSQKTPDGRAIDRTAWETRIATAAATGARLLALAHCELAVAPPLLTFETIQQQFTLLGAVAMLDPPRPEAIAAVAQCRNAGIRTLMITGDHATTAAAIGAQLGLRDTPPLTGMAIDALDDATLATRMLSTDVIARASPEHKLRLVRTLQRRGELVAMTGDGVNDAPALKAADIGVAMGQRGTDAAREASDLILTDDNFATLAAAVRQGRGVFDNIRKSLLFILPTNGGEAGVILLALFAGLVLPVTPAQILWINLVTTVTLALALAFEPPELDTMRRPPRPPREPLITRAVFGRILYISLLMMTATFTIFQWQLGRTGDIDSARTAAVNMLAIGELVYLFAIRRFAPRQFWKGLFSGNRVALGAAAVLVLLQLGFSYLPVAQELFQTRPPDALCWLAIVAAAATLFLAAVAPQRLYRPHAAQT